MAIPWETRGKKHQNPLALNASSRKKVLSLVLCVAVMLSVMVLGAGAAFSDQDKIENTEAVDACSALNIIGGYEDGSFHPERNIKRSEITKMICVALNGGNEPNVSTNAVPTFSDVRGTSAEWAEGYIESCVAQGIVSGVGGGRFSPDGNVTGAQLAKMLLVALGYNSDNEGFTGNAWETNVNVRASQKGLYAGLESLDTSAAVTRDQAAQMVWNALNAYEVEYKTTLVTDENGQLVSQVTVQDKVVNSNDDKITLLTDKYEAYVNVGTLESINGQDLTLYMTTSDKDDSDKENINSFTNVSADYSALLGQKVKVMFTKANNVLGVYATNDNTTYTVNMKDISADGNKVELDSGTYSFDDGAKIPVVKLDVNNETVVTGATMTAAEFDAQDTGLASVKFVDNDGDGKLNIAIITEYLAKEVTYVGSDRITAGATYKMADENIAEDLAKDDYAMISYNMYDDCLDIVKAEVVTDTLNSSKTKTGYKQYEIGSTWYNISNDEANNVSVGDTVKAHIVAGVIVKIDTDDGTGAIPSNIAVVVGKGSGTLEGDQVKLRFFDGTTKTVTLDDKGDIKSADKATLGEAYKVSGTDSNTRLDNLTLGNKYNGYYYNTTTTGKTEDALAKTVKAKEIGGQKVDDNAVVILYTDNGSSKKITGKQFNALSQTTLTANDAAYGTAFTKDVNGLCRVLLASVKVDSTSISGTSYDNYGYIVSDGAEKANGDVAFTMWNGSENVDVLWENGDADKLVKGTLVAYSSVDDNKYVQDGEVIGTLEQIKDGKALVTNEGFTASQNRAEDSKTISVDGYSLDVTADTKVLVLDTDADKSADIGQPYSYGDTIATAAKKADGTYCYNVVYRIEDNGAKNDGADLDLLVVDVTGAFDFDKPGEDSGNQGTIDNDIKDVTTVLNPANGELTIAFTVPAGTEKVSIDYEARVGGIIAASGTATETENAGVGVKITVNGTQAKFTIKLDPAASSMDDVTLNLTNLKYNGFGEGASAATINEALKQEDASITLTKVPSGKIDVPEKATLTIKSGAIVPADSVISVANGATVDMTGATVTSGAQVNVAAGGKVILPNKTEISDTKMTADCTLNLKADRNGVTVTVPENGTVTLKTNVTLGANDKIVLGKGAKLVGSASETLTVATAGSVSGDIGNFYQSSGANKEDQVRATTYTWTTNKWIAS